MTLHIGTIIKTKLKERGMSISEFGRRLNTSRKNVYHIFNRGSINTATLSEICKILDYDFFTHYTLIGSEVASLKEQVAALRTTLNEILKSQKNN